MFDIRSHIFLSLIVVGSITPAIAGTSTESSQPTPPSPTKIYHALALANSPKYLSDFTHFDYASPDAPKGGIFHGAQIGSFDNLAPFIISKAGLQIDLVYDQLLISPRDDPFTFYPSIAESVEIAEDNSYAIFHLNPKARWQDGIPITAEDVVFTFDTLKNNFKAVPYFRMAYQNVAGAMALDSLRVKFTFTHNENRVLPYILGTMHVLPKHYYQDHEFGKTFLEPPLGSGPYRVGQVIPGYRIVYERVKDYWACDLPTRRGLYNFDKWIVDYYRDAQAQAEAFKAGLFDFIFEYDPSRWLTYDDLPATARGQLVKVTSHLRGALGSMGFTFNLRRPPFDNRLLREAITQLFDFEWINSKLLRSWAQRASSFFPNSELAAKGPPSPAELELLLPWRGRIPDQIFDSAFIPPVSNGNGYLRTQRRKAFDLFRQAGYTIKNGQLVDQKGDQLKIEILSGTFDYNNVILTFATSLERVGIEVVVRQVDSSQFQWRSSVSFDFDLVFQFVNSTEMPGREQRLSWGSQFAYERYTANISGVQNPAIDSLVKNVEQASTRQEVITAIRTLDRILSWNYYILPGWYYDSTHYVYWNKFGRADEQDREGSLRQDLGWPAVEAWWAK
jgi:microcin C transport system substrate-binding protein